MELKEEKEIHRTAQDIINQLSVILRTAHIHDPGNIAVVTAIEKFLLLVGLITQAESQIKLELVGEFFYLNDTRVRYPLEYLLKSPPTSRYFSGDSSLQGSRMHPTIPSRVLWWRPIILRQET